MPPTIGLLLRGWRENRHLSQSELAGQADISTRHLSYVETGRSIPSREMVLHLSEQLDVPLRDRNGLLLAAGYAPVYSQRTLQDEDPEMSAVREAVKRLLASHDPYPAICIDLCWDIVARNDSTAVFVAGIAPELLVPPVNALRLALHPAGLAPRIANLVEWSAYLFRRLERQIALAGNRALMELAEELHLYPGVAQSNSHVLDPSQRVFVPLCLKGEGHNLRFLNMVATFGTALDVTVDELVVETFYPADAITANELGRSRL